MSVYNHDVVNSINQIPNRDTLTHEDLRVFYGTGQSIHVSGTGRYKEYDYRVGVQTKIGDIKIDVWCQLAKELIKRSGEDHLYQRLFNWEKEHNYCHRTKRELEIHVLELYCMRIFDRPNWVDYEAFSEFKQQADDDEKIEQAGTMIKITSR